MINSLTTFVKSLFGNKYERDIKEITPIVEIIKNEFEKLATISDDELRNKTQEFKQIIQSHISAELQNIAKLKEEAQNNADILKKEALFNEVDEIEKEITNKVAEKLDEILPQAFAVVKETAVRLTKNGQLVVHATEMDKRIAASKNNVIIEGEKAIWKNTWLAAGAEVKWDMIHYDVQLLGGVVLHKGRIAEMATGEGKTLVATLPVYLNALSGRGVHIVTVNDYLAKRDSEWMGPLFEFHGLTVDCIDKHQPNSDQRRTAYWADITFGTNNEYGFDYLRDNMANRMEDLVQRKHNFAIVDEVDSVLIDDARTPLIISGPTPRGDHHEFVQLKPKVEKLVKAQRDYVNTVLVDAKKLLADNPNTDKKTTEKNEKEGGLALLRAYRGLPRNKALIKFLSEPGIKAILQKTENNYLQDNAKEMPKVDAELFFTIDEKNNSIELQEKGIELITDSTQDADFFVMPDIGSAIADIDKSSIPDTEKLKKKDALMQDFTVKSERIHTINQLLKAYTLFENDVEYVIMENKVKIVDEQTGRIMEGRRYSDGLHQAIEAKENVKIEAATQTYATVTLQNYFRMYNKLAGMTGTAETEAGEFWEIYKLDVTVIPTNRPISRKDMEDKVYKTAREKFNAVIDEIVELTNQKRPVLVGTTSVEISELLGRMLKMRNIKHQILNAKMHQREAEIVAEAGKPGTVTIATNMAGRGTDIKLGEGVKESGGLAIIGTERHESRRVDRQLRGRAGRQGDPGSSQFFVSLEDNLMRLFGSDRIARLMDRMGIEEGEVIQHSMISKSIERAQKKVEENNFGVRKRLLEYDDVMNSQREVIYDKRRHALDGERLSLDISNSIYDISESLVEEFHTARDFDGFKLELIRVLSIQSPVADEKEFNQIDGRQLADKIYERAYSAYNRKSEFIMQVSRPVISNVYENQSATYENIVVPFTDGIKQVQVQANLKKSYESNGREVISSLEKGVTLNMIDDVWKEHLREMDELRQSVQSAVYEQKDPLLIYKFESFELFNKMLDKVNKDIISFLMRANLPKSENTQVKDAASVEQRPELAQIKTSRTEIPQFENQTFTNAPGQEQEKPKTQPVRVDKKVGRNELCPCGSGKKFKHCHGKGIGE
jgi:preprotein translocase subunit SecA